MERRILSIYLLTAAVLDVVHAACYTPFGADRNALANVTDRYIWAPCDNNVAVSMCCAIGPGREPGQEDTCMSDGTCHHAESNRWYRESCTDQTWQDPACLKLFVNGTRLNETVGLVIDDEVDGGILNDVAITPCDDGSFCDGWSNRACCQAGMGIFVENGEQTDQRPSSFVEATPVQTTIPSATAVQSPAPQSSPAETTTVGTTPDVPLNTKTAGMPMGTKTALIVPSSLLGVLSVSIILWYFWHRRRRALADSKLQASFEKQSRPSTSEELPIYNNYTEGGSRPGILASQTAYMSTRSFRPPREQKVSELGIVYVSDDRAELEHKPRVELAC